MRYQTKLYTNVGEFKADFSYEETLKKIEEWNGILVLTRETKGERYDDGKIVKVDTLVTTRLNTKDVQILCYEEFAMTDIIEEEKKKKKK